jgi:hypothetical protein
MPDYQSYGEFPTTNREVHPERQEPAITRPLLLTKTEMRVLYHSLEECYGHDENTQLEDWIIEALLIRLEVLSH